MGRAKRASDKKQGRQKNPSRSASRSKNAGRKQGPPQKTLKHRRKKQKRRGRFANYGPQSLVSIQISKASIHSGWVKQLGGLIRWYAASTNTASPQALKEVEQMYLDSGCSLEATRDSILKALGAAKAPDEKWVEVSMIVENDEQRVQLPTEQRPGEGPAHATKVWNTTLVPVECVGKSYFCSVVNRSNIHLSCEMSIDGQKVAWNAPIPAQTTRSVKPETNRYFGQHHWVLRHAKRIPLSKSANRTQQLSAQRTSRLDQLQDTMASVPTMVKTAYESVGMTIQIQEVMAGRLLEVCQSRVSSFMKRGSTWEL